MYWVGMGEQHGVHLMNISAGELKTGAVELDIFHRALGPQTE